MPIFWIHSNLSLKKLPAVDFPKICCDQHREEMVPFLLYEYIEIRYHLEAKRFKNEVLEKLKVEQQKLRKLSKHVT